MKHLKALAIKFFMVLAVLFLMLIIFENATFLDILLISLLVTGVTYIIGDLWLLPRIGIVPAALADFGLSFAGIWLLSLLFIEQAYPAGVISGFAAFFIAVAEGFFHRYMLEHVVEARNNEDDPTYISKERLQTEFAEEHDDKDDFK